MEFLKRNTSGRAGRRPRLMLGDRALPVLEPRVVPTVLAGPYYNYNPSFGTTAVFEEVGSTMQVTVSLAAGAKPVYVAYASYDNATANPTAYGDHNQGRQVLQQFTNPRLLKPGDSVKLTLNEDKAGMDQGQVTGTQFDVYLDPTGPPIIPATTTNPDGIIAYRDAGNSTAGVTATLDFATLPITASVDAKHGKS